MTWAEYPTDLAKPGHIPRGDEWMALLDQVSSLTAPGWTSWTPSWTSDGTQPALGNGTIAGRYRRVNGGDLVHSSVRLVMGSTTTYGTLGWHFNNPVTMSASAQLDNVAWGIAYDASSTGLYTITARIESSVWRFATGGGSVVLSTVPFTWATGDILLLNSAYEPA